MNKTFYLKEEDAAVWDRARELADDKLSPVIVAALRKFVAEQEAQINLMERIVIRYNDKATDGRPMAKAFYGRWLITPEDLYPAQRGLVPPALTGPPNFFANLAGAQKTSYQPQNRSLPLSSLVGATYSDIPPLTTWRKGYAVAVSAKGGVVLCSFEGNPELPSGWVWTYPSFDDALDSQEPGSYGLSALHEALQRQGVPVQELDI